MKAAIFTLLLVVSATSTVSSQMKTEDMIAASMFFGLIGGLIAADAASTFDMMLDHINGGFIHLREVATTYQ